MRWTISWHPHADGLTGATREMQEYATPAKELSHAYVGWPGGQLFILSKDMEVFVFRIDEGQQVDEGMDFESSYDGVWCQDGAFTKAEIHGSDLWAYAGNDRGMIIHNAVGKEIKWANDDGKINVYKVG